MKRQDTITKLMNEGFSQKTLVNLNDKQLYMLAERILSEQYAVSTSTSTPTPDIQHISKTNLIDINAAKKDKQTFATYEGEVKEDEQMGTTEKKQDSDKELAMKRLVHKIKTNLKDKKKVDDYLELSKKLNNGKIPENIQSLIHGKKEKVREKEPVSENKKVKKWVNKLVEAKFFTSKNEIMELIHTKINEQEVMEPKTRTLPDFLTFDSIKSSAEPKTAEPITKPTTKPGTRPTTKPTPRTPYQPGPGPKHNPKAKVMEEKKSIKK